MKLKILARVIARRTGLGCWCCGRYGRAVMFYRWQKFGAKRTRWDVTWCSECKFAACPYCCDDVPTQRNLWTRKEVV